MDWKYKHFNHEAVFNAPDARVLEAARAVVGEALTSIEDREDAFVASGYSALHQATAVCRVSPVANGTRLAIELVVARSTNRGYMLFDVGSYFGGEIDKWFTRIARELGGTQEEALISKSTGGVKVRRGCMAGCAVWLLMGACLALLALPLDRARSGQTSMSSPGPFGAVAAAAALAAGVIAFLYVAAPEAPISKFIRARLARGEK